MARLAVPGILLGNRSQGRIQAVGVRFALAAVAQDEQVGVELAVAFLERESKHNQKNTYECNTRTSDHRRCSKECVRHQKQHG